MEDDNSFAYALILTRFGMGSLFVDLCKFLNELRSLAHVRISFLSNIPRINLTSSSNKMQILNRGSYMSAHVLLNLLNELGKRDKMRGLPSILSLFRNEFNKFNNTRAGMLDSILNY